MLKPGDKILHQYNPELGPGEVLEVAGDRMRIQFPRGGEILEFSAQDHAFKPLILPEGADPERWYEAFHEDMVERLARLEVDSLQAWENRLDSLRLARIREADGLGSFLGGRIEIYPHQIHVAEQAVATDPVRWLLADEVGLGKTVEACLILTRLQRTQRADRILIVTPASLTVQWLGELYRKFHQIFVLLNEERRQDVRRDLGEEFNPFEVHPRSVIALEDLVADAELVRRAEAANLDLLVVDEAHRLERRHGHPGSPSYRSVAPLCRTSRHLLLLSATPLEADAHGFFRLLELLRATEYRSWETFRANLDQGIPLFPCTSSTTRPDIGGLPPRVAHSVPLPADPAATSREQEALGETATNVLDRKRRAERLQATLSMPTGADDARIQWIVEQEPAWRESGEKWLVFVHGREALDVLKKEIERKTFQRVAVFHEDLTPASQDLEVAQFALPEGPTILISTEAGGEGRNFHFCKGLVLFDLPWDPVLVEQRIGRLDRINRKIPVEIVCFVPAEGFGAQILNMYHGLGIFSEPLGGLDRSLGHVEDAILEACQTNPPRLDIPSVVAETHDARQRMNRALYHDLHRHRYRPKLAESIRSRIPADLEDRTAGVVLEACQQFGFETVAKPGEDTWYIEFGHEAVIHSLPDVPEGSRWLGTFSREEAVEHETLDFFASGHPLVEGILLELEDGHRGQVTAMEIEGTGIEGEGLAVVVKRGSEFEAIVVDLDGHRRPEWSRFIVEEPGSRRPASSTEWDSDVDAWATRVRELLYPLQSEGKLVAAAVFRFV